MGSAGDSWGEGLGGGERESSDPKEESCRDGAALSQSWSITGPLMGGGMVAHMVRDTWLLGLPFLAWSCSVGLKLSSPPSRSHPHQRYSFAVSSLSNTK